MFTPILLHSCELKDISLNSQNCKVLLGVSHLLMTPYSYTIVKNHICFGTHQNCGFKTNSEKGNSADKSNVDRLNGITSTSP